MQLDKAELTHYHLLVSLIGFGAGYCMILYDWISCIDLEFKFICKAKFSFTKIIYLFCRYWPIVTVPYVLRAYAVPHTWETCEQIFRIPVDGSYPWVCAHCNDYRPEPRHFLAWMTVVATWNLLGSEVVLLARTVAFRGNNRVIFYSLSACLVAATAYQNWVVFKPMLFIPFISDDRHGVCLPSSPGHEIFGYFLSSLAVDTLVSLLIIYRVFQLRGAGDQLSRSPLVQLFVSEGLWLFFLVSIVNLVNGLVFARQEKSLQATAVPFLNMLPPILACRVILDLHEHGSAEGNSLPTAGKDNVGLSPLVFLYSPKSSPTAPCLSTMRFQNPIRDAGEDGDNIVDTRDLLVSPAKPDRDEAAPRPDNQF
ncbi:hypothetical protein M407DRAFT_33666 [Tulasnella calospora MUT 4182]|uniref:DUF6533 domain-containing protein n=1 Tax=Tulasnella calospora MUT 4182 TaxID=1051891 RepID=A0A0C3PQ74_9AGAM|nr:hypothetical protein M407DRAFT_33666 [Tulasnella calospora MUT 4182]